MVCGRQFTANRVKFNIKKHALGMGINKNSVITIPLSISLIDSHWVLIDSGLRATTIAKQHIKDIRFMQINCMMCGQMFVHVGGISPLFCYQCCGGTQEKK